MSAAEPRSIDVGGPGRARRIAILQTAPKRADAPGFLWLQGLKSEMVSTKATALDAWCRDRGYGCTRFDYSGHGRSGGVFEEATIGDWLEEAHAVFAACTSGPQVLVGSSTGGYIALLLLREIGRAHV